MAEVFALTVNGVERQVTTEPDTPLLYVLRNSLGLVGTRFGCGVGLCGACFVRIDDAVVPSCDTPISSAAARRVTTVEGLADGSSLHAVQRAVLRTQAGQCGYCLSGILVSAAALLDRDPAPDEVTVADALDRNLCRCGAHRRIVAAIVAAADE
ncbi:(2Fe-2S)-binding protein [Cryptosporangium aurantiacum]|uniref:Nicotinate dehydrogenase subunit A n=1 Tax=Cryptosporangium aurantiacum TaxID=134849 RepID=A0A1M7RMK3_9ACTN|nr:(2Fe-2S)-binding protein [Cryptosporangium aurantiacum]SHN47318.1 nicotinate dehydrogenase subunit A [Cryptosporangium aurantiacum]